MATMAKAAILAVVVALAVQLAAAADHPVGGDGSWDASGNGYDAWSATQTFKPGDTLCKNTKHNTSLSMHMHLSIVIVKQ